MQNKFRVMARFLRSSGLSDREIGRRLGIDGQAVVRIAEGQMPRHDVGEALSKLFLEQHEKCTPVWEDACDLRRCILCPDEPWNKEASFYGGAYAPEITDSRNLYAFDKATKLLMQTGLSPKEVVEALRTSGVPAEHLDDEQSIALPFCSPEGFEIIEEEDCARVAVMLLLDRVTTMGASAPEDAKAFLALLSFGAYTGVETYETYRAITSRKDFV